MTSRLQTTLRSSRSCGARPPSCVPSGVGSTLLLPHSAPDLLRTLEESDDQQTIILGGLIQDDVTINDNKVPFLGSIPALGWLFRSESRSNTKRNLLIFLRPSVIRDKSGADSVTQRKYDEIWEVDIIIPGAGETPGAPHDLFDGRN